MDVNTRCPGCDAPKSFFLRDGFYARADDAKFIQRFKCKRCAKKFSAATFSATYRQKKRRINSTVRFGLPPRAAYSAQSGSSAQRAAR